MLAQGKEIYSECVRVSRIISTYMHAESPYKRFSKMQIFIRVHLASRIVTSPVF